MKGRDSRGVISVPGGKLRWGCYPVGLTWRKNEGGMGGGQERGARSSRLDRTQGKLSQGEDVWWSPNLHTCVH